MLLAIRPKTVFKVLPTLSKNFILGLPLPFFKYLALQNQLHCFFYNADSFFFCFLVTLYQFPSICFVLCNSSSLLLLSSCSIPISFFHIHPSKHYLDFYELLKLKYYLNQAYHSPKIFLNLLHPIINQYVSQFCADMGQYQKKHHNQYS